MAFQSVRIWIFKCRHVLIPTVPYPELVSNKLPGSMLNASGHGILEKFSAFPILTASEGANKAAALFRTPFFSTTFKRWREGYGRSV